MTIIDIPLPTVEETTPTKRLINIGPLAAALIREQGWWDGSFDSSGLPETGFCVFLALEEVCPPTETLYEPQLMEALGLPLQWDEDFPIYDLQRVFAWNDSHTAEEVIAVLDNAKIMVEV